MMLWCIMFYHVQYIGNYADRPHVDRFVVSSLGSDNFRRDVVGCSTACFEWVFVVKRFAEAEISDDHPKWREFRSVVTGTKKVLRFEITMSNSLPMKVCNSFTYLMYNLCCIGFRIISPFNDFIE